MGNKNNDNLVGKTLAKSEIHSRWINDYFSDENREFYHFAFEFLKTTLKIPNDIHILDVGCGSGTHSITLANIGFRVTGIDYSEYILEIAAENVANAGLSDKITLLHGNILSLNNIPDFDYILCWGVLMHIPDYETALSELARILKPGGLLIISECNMHSIQSRFHSALNKLLNKSHLTTKKNYGLEQWWDSPSGKIIVRMADIPWMEKYFANKNIILIRRFSGQFTELYTAVSNKYFLKFIYKINIFWFKNINLPGLAFGNILAFRKKG